MADEKKLVNTASLVPSLGLSEMLFHYRDGAARVEMSSPVYLTLPVVIASLSGDRAYCSALPFGRFSYRDEIVADEQGPLVYLRSEVLDIVDSMVRLRDTRLSAAVPLAWRVGFAVGWLSGLSVVQEDEAQAGMVLLAALVAPLLVPQRSGKDVTQKKLRKVARSSRRRSARK